MLALSEPAWNLEEERRQGWAVQEQHVEAQGTGLAMTKCHLLHVTQPLWALISTSENNRRHFRESAKGPSDRNTHQARNRFFLKARAQMLLFRLFDFRL